MAPFFLLVLLILLLVWRFFGPPIFSSGSSFTCPEGAGVYRVEKGDTCWGIAQREGISVDDLEGWNDGLECEALRVGMKVCVPE